MILLALVLQNITLSTDLKILELYLFGANSPICAGYTIYSLSSSYSSTWTLIFPFVGYNVTFGYLEDCMCGRKIFKQSEILIFGSGMQIGKSPCRLLMVHHRTHYFSFLSHFLSCQRDVVRDHGCNGTSLPILTGMRLVCLFLSKHMLTSSNHSMLIKSVY